MVLDLVRSTGLEPALCYELEPKSSVSANSTMTACTDDYTIFVFRPSTVFDDFLTVEKGSFSFAYSRRIRHFLDKSSLTLYICEL